MTATGRRRRSRPWWPAARPWGDRWRELRAAEVLGHESWAPSVVAVPFAPVTLLAMLRPDRHLSGALVLLACIALVVLGVKRLDGRLAWREQVRSNWSSPELLTAAARYRLAPAATSSVPTETVALDLVRRPFPAGRPATDVGALVGVVRGREVALLQRLSAKGLVLADVVGLARLDHRQQPFTVARRIPVFRRLPDDVDLPFDRRFVVRGKGGDAVGPALQRWLMEEAGGFEFEVAGDWVACRWWQRGLPPERVGVYLAALIGFAQRLEAP